MTLQCPVPRGQHALRQPYYVSTCLLNRAGLVHLVSAALSFPSCNRNLVRDTVLFQRRVSLSTTHLSVDNALVCTALARCAVFVSRVFWDRDLHGCMSLMSVTWSRVLVTRSCLPASEQTAPPFWGWQCHWRCAAVWVSIVHWRPFTGVLLGLCFLSVRPREGASQPAPPLRRLIWTPSGAGAYVAENYRTMPNFSEFSAPSCRYFLHFPAPSESVLLFEWPC